MRKAYIIVTVVMCLISPLGMMRAEARTREKVVGQILSTLTARETRYGETPYPVGTTRLSDDLSETKVVCTGAGVEGNPYTLDYTLEFKVSTRTYKLSDREYAKDLARKCFIKTGVPKKLWEKGGSFTWRIKKATLNRVAAELVLTKASGEQRVFTHITQYYRGDGWYTRFTSGGKAETAEELLRWVKE